jgi:hypothetical protein
VSLLTLQGFWIKEQSFRATSNPAAFIVLEWQKTPKIEQTVDISG